MAEADECVGEPGRADVRPRAPARLMPTVLLVDDQASQARAALAAALSNAAVED